MLHTPLEVNMKKIFIAASFLILGAACAHRYGVGVGYYDNGWGPGWWGTVSYVSPSYVDFDYVDGGGRHFTRRAYWDRSSQWGDGMAYNTLRPGERVYVRGHDVRGRYHVDDFRDRDRH